jgi:hypothetical protein
VEADINSQPPGFLLRRCLLLLPALSLPQHLFLLLLQHSLLLLGLLPLGLSCCRPAVPVQQVVVQPAQPVKSGSHVHARAVSHKLWCLLCLRQLLRWLLWLLAGFRPSACCHILSAA